MSRLLTFFKHSDSEFGIFYPKHYLLAAYPKLEDAERAVGALKNAGWADDDVIAVPGEEVVRYQEDHLLLNGLWGLAMSQLSRFIDTEQPYADADLAAAKRGAAFIAVHCHTETIKAEAWKVLVTTNPIVARYYHAGGVDLLTGRP
jgi:hypothetical protein